MFDIRSHTARIAAIVGSTALMGAGVFAGASTAAASDTPVLSVKKLSVSKGSTAGGTAVLVTGKGFNALSESSPDDVKFGTVSVASFTILSDTQLVTKAPAPGGTDAASLTKVQVTITDGTHTSANTTADDFTYLPPVTAVAPASTVLSAAGGTVVQLTLTGDGLDVGTATSFNKKLTAMVNGVPGKLSYADTGKVNLTAPAGTPTITGGTVTITVLNDGVAGTPDLTARYVAVVTKLSVASGKTLGTTGGTKPALTITGAGLTGATAWKIGTQDLTCVPASAAKAATTWTCQDVPAATTPGPVSVVPSFGTGVTSGLTSGATYTYSDLG